MKEWELYRKAHDGEFHECVIFEKNQVKNAYSVEEGLTVSEMALERGLEDITEWELLTPDDHSLGAVVLDERGMPTDTMMVFL